MSINELNDQLDSLKEQIKGQAPTEVFDTFAQEQRVLDATTDRSGFVKAGDTLEAFTLPDATGTSVSLDELLAEGPAVIVFYRGGWCPYCNLTLRNYQEQLLPDLDQLGARLVAVSPQTPDGSLSLKEKNELTFTVLSDLGNGLARKLGITFTVSEDVREVSQAIGNDLGEVNATGTWELPHPTVLVVGTDGVVAFADVHPDYTTRTELTAIVAAVRGLR
jgi:peroxiredoxin